MLILIMMVVAVVLPLVMLIVTEVMDAKYNREYYAAMESHYEAKHQAKWGKVKWATK